MIEVRRESASFGAWESFRLTADGCEQLYVPRGYAHGFYVLSDVAVVTYKQTAPYDPTSEGQVLWNDSAIGITWPIEGDPIVSAKDRAAPPLSAVLLPR